MTSRSHPLVVVAVLVIWPTLIAGCSAGDAGGRRDDTPSAGPDREIHVEDVTVIEPAGANSAAYLTIRNDGPDTDRLVEVRSADAERTELHETTADGDGLLRMHPVEGIDLPVGETVRLEPGGLHAMLVGVDELVAGSTTALELVFEHGPAMTVDATVRTHAELIG